MFTSERCATVVSFLHLSCLTLPIRMCALIKYPPKAFLIQLHICLSQGSFCLILLICRRNSPKLNVRSSGTGGKAKQQEHQKKGKPVILHRDQGPPSLASFVRISTTRTK